MACKLVFLIPVSISIIIPVCGITTYLLAVFMSHVEPLFPFLSSTGQLPPESCIFGQGFNITAFLLLCFVYVRYRQLSYFTGNGLKQKVNKIALIAGIISSVGLSILSNFQQFHAVFMHLMGSFLAFVGGMVYFCLQTWLTHLCPELTARYIFVIRLVLSSTTIVNVLIGLTAPVVAYTQFQNEWTAEGVMKWKPEDGGYPIHLVSTFNEWITTAIFCVILLTFVPEFRDITINPPVFEFKQNTAIADHPENL